MEGFTLVRLTVQISSRDPLRGTLSEPGQPDRPFTGWTALATLMDTIVRRETTTEPVAYPDPS